MDYREALIQEVNAYYKEVIEKYKLTTTESMKDAKKMGLFKKPDFTEHIEKFKNHILDAQDFKNINIEIPSNDFSGKEVADKLQKSAESFCNLCSSSVNFYRMEQKKRKKYSDFKMSDYKRAYNVMQTTLADAVVDLDELDKAYRKYAPEQFPQED